MPAAERKLVVQGKVECPTTGWTGQLVKAVPQGINPAILILDAQLAPPRGLAGKILSDVDVRFEDAGGTAFSQVTIRGAGPDLTVTVKQAESPRPH